MQEITENRIGVSEMLVASGVAGIIYGSLAVQPLVILALTGPVLVFEEAVFHVCSTVHMYIHTQVPRQPVAMLHVTVAICEQVATEHAYVVW